MTAHRPNGTGTIERTPKGRYRARFAFDGKRREAIRDEWFWPVAGLLERIQKLRLQDDNRQGRRA